jgi:membrane fusion protein (multidrug efflux system)
MEKGQRSRRIRVARRWRFLLVLIAILGGSVFAGLRLWSQGAGWVSTEDAYVTGHLLTIKAQAPGTITEILAENTQRVEAGAVLVRLEGTRALIALREAEAVLGGAVRRVVGLHSAAATLKGRIAAEEAMLTKVKHDLARYQNVDHAGAVAAQQVENARDEARTIEARIQERKAELAGAVAQVAGTEIPHHPEVSRAAAAYERAYLDWVRQEVRAPVAGYIARRKAAVGDQVLAGAPLLVLVPLEHLWVEANVKETDLAHIRAGQAAEIRVNMGGEGSLYHGTVEGIQPGTGSVFALLPPEYATGNYIHIVERVPVRIALQPQELSAHPLRAGLSTVTRIRVEEGEIAPLTSHIRTDAAPYRTRIYADELKGAAARIGEIIAAHLHAPGAIGSSH